MHILWVEEISKRRNKHLSQIAQNVYVLLVENSFKCSNTTLVNSLKGNSSMKNMKNTPTEVCIPQLENIFQCRKYHLVNLHRGVHSLGRKYYQM